MTKAPLLLLLLALALSGVYSFEFPETYPNFPEKRATAGGSCVSNGKTYKHGETFKKECNTCICTNGAAACTLMDCPGCTHDNIYYNPRERFTLDFNTTCECVARNRIGCQYMPNPIPHQCYFNGKIYKKHEEFPKANDCNKCYCLGNNLVVCSRIDCNNRDAGCVHQGKRHKQGDLFVDQCNVCWCNPIDLYCTELTCI